MPYLFLKDTHSLLRWIVIIACLWALARVWSGFFGRAEWSKKDQTAGLIFTSLLNFQLLLGLVLYAISPITRSAMGNFAGAMKDSVLRFYAVEHLAGMLLAVALTRKSDIPSPSERRRTAGNFSRPRSLFDRGADNPGEHTLALHEIWARSFPVFRRLKDLKMHGFASSLSSIGESSS